MSKTSYSETLRQMLFSALAHQESYMEEHAVAGAGGEDVIHRYHAPLPLAQDLQSPQIPVGEGLIKCFPGLSFKFAHI